MSAYILPILFILLFIYCIYKRLNTYDHFVKGAKGAIKLVVDIFPFIASIMIAVALLRVSGITSWLTQLLSPIFNALGVPPELTELVLLRPFTGSGSYALLEDVLVTYGADSYISRCACVIMGCSETIFYVATVYFSQTKVKKLLYAIPVALLCSTVGTILACLLCRVM
ncbi:MAG TPA: spore maturation protein [Candidatus Caccovivens faecavium]|nr:spore maturation protein [Candidatus Caccovivens faecavium]